MNQEILTNWFLIHNNNNAFNKSFVASIWTEPVPMKDNEEKSTYEIPSRKYIDCFNHVKEGLISGARNKGAALAMHSATFMNEMEIKAEINQLREKSSGAYNLIRKSLPGMEYQQLEWLHGFNADHFYKLKNADNIDYAFWLGFKANDFFEKLTMHFEAEELEKRLNINLKQVESQKEIAKPEVKDKKQKKKDSPIASFKELFDKISYQTIFEIAQDLEYMDENLFWNNSRGSKSRCIAFIKAIDELYSHRNNKLSYEEIINIGSNDFNVKLQKNLIAKIKSKKINQLKLSSAFNNVSLGPSE